ncbi:DUF2786 domain-containing protein [uncultured Alsobacter sp.]|uniref:DUF2786 domain-containing protein n=1 Tax=uncultured Alsobacter sp. TaxID=1748258 RepID=UPI0025D51CFA|nr:DUF2786 domain-containing protein [uncultured Alsobacter sp.]
MTDETQLEKLKHRIRALLAKSVENGATEAEAMAAAAKAQELLAKYGIETDELDAEAFVTERFEAKKASRKFDWSDRIGYGVGLFTGTFPFKQPGKPVSFHGRETDAFFALWLCDALDGFITRAAMAYVAETGKVRSTGKGGSRYIPGQGDMFAAAGTRVQIARPEADWERDLRMKNYGMGCADRICARLTELATDASWRKADDAQRDLSRKGWKFAARSRHDHVGDEASYAAGEAAGERATFSRPVGSSGASAPLGIGGR